MWYLTWLFVLLVKAIGIVLALAGMCVLCFFFILPIVVAETDGPSTIFEYTFGTVCKWVGAMLAALATMSLGLYLAGFPFPAP
jgi:hypothetical protein